MKWLISAMEWFLSNYRELDLTAIGTGKRHARLIMPHPPRLVNEAIYARQITYAVLMLVAEGERRRRQHKRVGGCSDIHRICRDLLYVPPLDPRNLMLLPRMQVRKKLHEEVEQIARLVLGARRATRRNDKRKADWDRSLRWRLERLEIICDEMLDAPGLGKARLPLKDALPAAFSEVWTCLYGGEAPEALQAPPLPMHLYTTLLEIVLGLTREAPAQEFS